MSRWGSVGGGAYVSRRVRRPRVRGAGEGLLSADLAPRGAFYARTLRQVAQRLQASGLARERRVRFRGVFEEAVEGREVVDFLVFARQCGTRGEAVAIGSALLQAGYLVGAAPRAGTAPLVGGGSVAREFGDDASLFALTRLAAAEEAKEVAALVHDARAQMAAAVAAEEAERIAMGNGDGFGGVGGVGGGAGGAGWKGGGRRGRAMSEAASERRSSGTTSRSSFGSVGGDVTGHSLKSSAKSASPSLSFTPASISTAARFRSGSADNPLSSLHGGSSLLPSLRSPLPATAEAEEEEEEDAEKGEEEPGGGEGGGAGRGGGEGGGEEREGGDGGEEVEEEEEEEEEDPLVVILEEERDLSKKEEELRGRTVRAGWLWKQGHQVRNWRKRWFVLRGSRMSYFSKPEDGREKGAVDILDYYLVPSEVPRPSVSMRLCNKRVAGTELDYLIHSETVEEFVAWVKAIASVQRDFEEIESARVDLAARKDEALDLKERTAAAHAALEARARRVKEQEKEKEKESRRKILKRTRTSDSTRLLSPTPATPTSSSSTSPPASTTPRRSKSSAAIKIKKKASAIFARKRAAP